MKSFFDSIKGAVPCIIVEPCFKIDDPKRLMQYYMRTNCKAIEDTTLNYLYSKYYSNGKLTPFSERKSTRVYTANTLSENLKKANEPFFISLYIFYNFDDANDSDLENMEFDEKNEMEFVLDKIYEAIGNLHFEIALSVSHIAQRNKGTDDSIQYPHFHVNLSIDYSYFRNGAEIMQSVDALMDNFRTVWKGCYACYKE